MKLTVSLSLFTSFILALSAHAQSPETSSDKWLKLSAKTQNLHLKVNKLGQDVGLDYSNYKTELDELNSILNAMVEAEILFSKRIKLKPINAAPENLYKALQAEVYKISTTYGFYVASEMCDLGSRLKFTTFQPDQPIELHLRLPKKELSELIQTLKTKNLLTQ